MALIVVKRNFPQPLRAAGLCQGLRKCEPIRAQTPRMSLKFWQCPSPAIESTRYRHNCDYSDVNRLAIGKAPRPGGKGRTCCDSAPSVASLPQRPRRTDSAKRLRVWAGFRVASAHSNARRRRRSKRENLGGRCALDRSRNPTLSGMGGEFGYGHSSIRALPSSTWSGSGKPALRVGTDAHC